MEALDWYRRNGWPSPPFHDHHKPRLGHLVSDLVWANQLLESVPHPKHPLFANPDAMFGCHYFCWDYKYHFKYYIEEELHRMIGH